MFMGCLKRLSKPQASTTRSINISCKCSTDAVFGFVDSLGRGNTISHNNIVPNPSPPAAAGPSGNAPLLSTNADGIHSVGAYVGGTISNNYLRNTGDDGIAVSAFCV